MKKRLFHIPHMQILSRQGYDVTHMARYLGVDINLMLIKIHEMKRIGYGLIIPLQYNSQFFRNIKGYEYHQVR